MSKENNILDELFDEVVDSNEYKKTLSRMKLAKKIKQGMDAKGWNKKTFAKEIGQQPSVITRWLSGTSNLTHDTMIDIENILDIKMLDNAEIKKSVTVSSEITKSESDFNYYNSYLNSSFIDDNQTPMC